MTNIKRWGILILTSIILLTVQYCGTKKVISKKDATITIQQDLIRTQEFEKDSINSVVADLEAEQYTNKIAFDSVVEQTEQLTYERNQYKNAKKRSDINHERALQYAFNECNQLLTDSTEAQIIVREKIIPIYETVYEEKIVEVIKLDTVEVDKIVIKQVIPLDYISIDEAVKTTNKVINKPWRRISVGPSATLGYSRTMTDWDDTTGNTFDRAFNSFGDNEVGGTIGLGVTYRLNKLKVKAKHFKK